MLCMSMRNTTALNVVKKTDGHSAGIVASYLECRFY